LNLIDVSDLNKSYGPTRILQEVNFTLGDSEKVGIVGRNGCGKSTLFRILADLEGADSGVIARKRGLTFGYLPQKPSLDPDATVRQVIEAHLGEAREKMHRHEALTRALATARGDELQKLMDEQQAVHAWLDHHAAWNLGHRVEEICTRFGVQDLDARVCTLSGGWNQRVALAGVLLGQPDLLLLDEPTNQIDAETVEWLETHLAGYPGALLLVTHDRYFLDRVVARMFEVEDGRLTTHTGGYSAYLEQKAERLLLQERSQTRLLNLLRREEAWLARAVISEVVENGGELKRSFRSLLKELEAKLASLSEILEEGPDAWLGQLDAAAAKLDEVPARDAAKPSAEQLAKDLREFKKDFESVRELERSIRKRVGELRDGRGEEVPAEALAPLRIVTALDEVAKQLGTLAEKVETWGPGVKSMGQATADLASTP
jgi:ATP-binding cassette subfamily F protein uup